MAFLSAVAQPGPDPGPSNLNRLLVWDGSGTDQSSGQAKKEGAVAGSGSHFGPTFLWPFWSTMHAVLYFEVRASTCKNLMRSQESDGAGSSKRAAFSFESGVLHHGMSLS